MQFCINDFIETNTNIFTEKGLIDISKFKWLNLSFDKIPNFNFLEFTDEHNKLREVIDFDLSRFCELEIMKNKWTILANMSNHENILKRIKSLFEPCFIVQKVLYDDVGYYLFKIFLIAAIPGIILKFTLGKISSGDELGIQIEVLDTEKKISNEVKKNCLIYDRKNSLQTRIGDILVFYISKNK